MELRAALLIPCLFFLLFGPAAGAGESWTMSRAVTLALERHPALQAARARVEAAAGLQLQAGKRPNPELNLQMENLRFTGSPEFHAGDDLDIFAFVSRPWERGGKRERRVEVAGRDRRAAELELRDAEWKVRQQVRSAFLLGLQAQQRLALVEENGRNFEQIVQYHRVRVEQGAMAEADLLKVLLEQDRLEMEAASTRLDLERARLDLLRATGAEGQPTPSLLADEDKPAAGARRAGEGELLPLARERRADLLLGQAAIDAALARSNQQKSLAKPDWSLVAGYKRTAGFNTLLAGAIIPLPIANRNEGNIQASLADVEQARSMARVAERQAEAEIREALARIRRYHAMMTRLDQEVLARAEEFRRITLAAYQEGGADLLRLLDAERMRNEVQLLRVRTRMEYRLGLCELQAAVGDEDLLLSEEALRPPTP